MDNRSPEPSEAATLKAERVNQAYANEPAGLFGTALGGCVLAFVEAPVSGSLQAWAWCAILLAVTGARLWIQLRYRRDPVLPPDAGRWANIFRAGVLLSGLTWGSAAVIFLPAANPAFEIFTAFMIGGMVAGAAAAYSPLEWAFPAFVIPALAPVLGEFFLSEGDFHEPMVLMVVIYSLVIATVSRSVRASSWSAIRLKFENRGLLETLSRSMRETMDLNSTLKAEIREREMTEIELQRHREKLEGMVARRTEELSRANSGLREALEEKIRMEEERRTLEEQLQLARKMESLATLAGGIAHDFNNLLMGIGGQISLLMAARQASDPELDKLKSMEHQVREGAELTRQLLGMARGGKYEVKPLDPNALVRKVASLFARTHKEIRVSTRLEEGLGAVEADKGQIEQALLNICLNAWQAMPGGGSLDLSTRRMEMDEAKASPFQVKAGGFVAIALTDTGTGMDRSVLPRIFDPFFTTKGAARTGSGLGLSSAYGIVRNHGGFIEVDSEPGHGSTFTLYLPRSPLPAESFEGEEMADSEGASGRKTVLVVEDEPMVAEVAALMLNRLGLRVLKAYSGEAALNLFRESPQKIDLVLLDMIMPGMGGDETFRRLKELQADVRVLLSSGYSREGRAQELIKAGCLGFLQKPYNLGELRAKLEEVLSARLSTNAGMG